MIHKENGGLSAARNDGMRRATGEYLAFVDSDDCVDEKLYETLINALTEKDAELAVCSYIRIDEEGNMLPEDNWCCILPNLIESGVEIINMKGIPEVAQWVTVTAWILYVCGV